MWDNARKSEGCCLVWEIKLLLEEVVVNHVCIVAKKNRWIFGLNPLNMVFLCYFIVYFNISTLPSQDSK